MLTPQEFLKSINRALSPFVDKERTLHAYYSPGSSPGSSRGRVIINFINLPQERFKQHRGAGAEPENNRQMFIVYGFGETLDSSVAKVKVEQSINSIGSANDRPPKMRSKTSSPDNIAAYVATYINDVATRFPPKFTHE
jgi:hypothetical protein